MEILAQFQFKFNILHLKLQALDKDIENGYQQIAREGEQLRRTLSVLKTGEYGLEDDQLLRHQLICAQTTIAQQQVVIEQQQLQVNDKNNLLQLIKT